MNDADAAPRRKFAILVVCGVLALPLLYAASSGPVLMLASKNDEYHTRFGHVLGYYRPLLRVAMLTYLDGPLSRYLRFWHIGTVTPPPWITTRPDSLEVFPLR